jgi:hypothetical protein
MQERKNYHSNENNFGSKIQTNRFQYFGNQ